MRTLEQIKALLPDLIRIAGVKKVDLHGKSVDEAEKIIDRLSLSNDIVEVVTGHGTGRLKKLVKDLQNTYHYKILSTAPNDAAYILDFT